MTGGGHGQAAAGGDDRRPRSGSRACLAGAGPGGRGSVAQAAHVLGPEVAAYRRGSQRDLPAIRAFVGPAPSSLAATLCGDTATMLAWSANGEPDHSGTRPAPGSRLARAITSTVVVSGASTETRVAARRRCVLDRGQLRGNARPTSRSTRVALEAALSLTSLKWFIEEHHREVGTVPLGGGDLVAEPLVEAAVVADSRQRVAACQLLIGVAPSLQALAQIGDDRRRQRQARHADQQGAERLARPRPTRWFMKRGAAQPAADQQEAATTSGSGR